ncbi:MAG TPA: DMT family transporter [Polyangium sp.]|nr:DMT family transporter [Polyangium sp.]
MQTPQKQASAPTASRPTVAVHAALLLVQIAFGTLPVEGKIVMSPPHNVAPQALAMMRILGGALAFVLAYSLSPSAPKVSSWRDRFELALLAIFGVALNQALFLYGLSRTSPVSATLLIATIPVFTNVIAVLAGRDRMTPRTAVGLGLAIFGVVVLSGFAIPATGDLFVLLNAASYAVYVVFSKSSLARHGTLAAMAWIFGAATILFAPLGGSILVHDVQHWSLEAFAYVAFVVLVPTVLAYGLNAWALARANPALVTIYIYLQPLVVLVLSAVQLRQTPKIASLIGGLFILAGVTTVAILKSPEGSKPSPNRT